jgi:proteasome assembly chaperone (PAC2) family protein
LKTNDISMFVGARGAGAQGLLLQFAAAHGIAVVAFFGGQPGFHFP